MSASLVPVSLPSALAGAALAVLGMLAILPQTSRGPAHPASHHHAGTTSASSAGTNASHVGHSPFLAEMADVNARMHADMEIAPTGDVNQDFIRMMIPHHQGAIDMARVLLKYQPDERLKRLVQSIIVEQGQEIAYMQTLLGAPPAEASAATVTPPSKVQP